MNNKHRKQILDKLIKQAFSVSLTAEEQAALSNATPDQLQRAMSLAEKICKQNTQELINEENARAEVNED